MPLPRQSGGANPMACKMPSRRSHRPPSRSPAAASCSGEVTSISRTSGSVGSLRAVRWVRLRARPAPESTISAPSSWASLAAEKASEASVRTPVIRSRLPSRSPIALGGYATTGPVLGMPTTAVSRWSVTVGLGRSVPWLVRSQAACRAIRTSYAPAYLGDDLSPVESQVRIATLEVAASHEPNCAEKRVRLDPLTCGKREDRCCSRPQTDPNGDPGTCPVFSNGRSLQIHAPVPAVRSLWRRVAGTALVSDQGGARDGNPEGSDRQRCRA